MAKYLESFLNVPESILDFDPRRGTIQHWNHFRPPLQWLDSKFFLCTFERVLANAIQPFTQTSTPPINRPVPLRAVGTDNTKEHILSSNKASHGRHGKYGKIPGGFFTFTSIDEFYLRETSIEICVRPITGELHVRPITPAHGGEKTNVQVHLLLSSSDPNPTSPPEIEEMQTESGITIRRTDPCDENLKVIATIWISPGTSLMRHLSITTHSLRIIFHQYENNHFALKTSTNFGPNTFLRLSLPRQTDRARTENTTTPGAPSKSSPLAGPSTELTPSTMPSPAKSTDTSLLNPSTHQHPQFSGYPLNPSAPSRPEATPAPALPSFCIFEPTALSIANFFPILQRIIVNASVCWWVSQ